MEFNVKNFNKDILNQHFSSYVLGIDIGGTNTNIGIAGVINLKSILLFSLNFKSKELESLVPAINDTLSYAKNNYDIEVEFACIGAAGVVSSSNDSAQLTNVSWDVNSAELINKTSLQSVYIINDFQTVGYGVNLLDSNNKNDIFPIRTEKSDLISHRLIKAILGAGTGLGKSILIYDENFNAYIPIPSEGGHGDFPAQNNFELELTEFVKKLRGINQPLTYEEFLSGRGLESIYLFLRNKQEKIKTNFSDEIDNAVDKAPLISKYKEQDETCKETFRIFTRFYARCAKNFVLDSMALGGLYIAGGIAAKNKDIFKSKEFFREFENAYQRSDILKEIPIYIIVDYNVSLHGACFAAMLQSQK
jgi:glucokinase